MYANNLCNVFTIINYIQILSYDGLYTEIYVEHVSALLI